MKMHIVHGVRIVEEGQGNTIVLLHPSGHPPSALTAHIKLFSQDARLIAPNLYDIAGMVKVLDEKSFAQALDRILRELQANRVLLVGCSIGGDIALSYASLYSQAVSGVVVVDAVGIERKSIFIWLVVFIQTCIQSLLTKKSRDNVGFLPFVIEFLKHPLNVWKLLWFAMHASIEKYIPGVKAPVLLMWGEEDRLASLKTGKILKQKLANAHLIVVPQASHFWITIELEFFISNINIFRKSL